MSSNFKLASDPYNNMNTEISSMKSHVIPEVSCVQNTHSCQRFCFCSRCIEECWRRAWIRVPTSAQVRSGLKS